MIHAKKIFSRRHLLVRRVRITGAIEKGGFMFRKIIRSTLYLVGILCISYANTGNASMTFNPEANPDACKGGYQGTTPCGSWSYLSEIPEPDAWKYSTENREHRWRWYGEAAPAKEIVIIYKGINFDFDKYNLRPDSIPILQKDVANLKAYTQKNKNIRVIGHTDAKGSDAYNQKLSERRAKAVVDYFISQGIDPNRISSEGRGESEPIAPNTIDGKDNPAGRAENRRMELRIR